jgi:hypothetical protein
MYSRDAHPSYASVINLRSCYFQFKLPAANAAPTFVYGSNWIQPTLYGPGQVVPTTGNYLTTTLANNQIAFVSKDNFFGIIDADVAWRDASANGAYATMTYTSSSTAATNEATANPQVFVLNFFLASGSAVTPSSNLTGTVGGFVEINNGNVTSPGGN